MGSNTDRAIVVVAIIVVMMKRYNRYARCKEKQHQAKYYFSSSCYAIVRHFLSLWLLLKKILYLPFLDFANNDLYQFVIIQFVMRHKKNVTVAMRLRILG